MTFVTLGKEMDRLKELECKCNTKILVLPGELKSTDLLLLHLMK